MQLHSLTPKRLRPAPAVTVAAALVIAALAAPATGAPSTKYYWIEATPLSADVSTTTRVDVTFTLHNCGTGDVPAHCAKASTQSFGSAHVTLPAPWSWGYADGDAVPVTASADGKSAHWSTRSTAAVSSTTGTVVQLANDGTSSTYAIAPGESVSFTASLLPTPAGLAKTITQVKQSNDFSGTGNDFTAVTASPTIVIGPPDHLEFGVPPQTVQQSTSAKTYYMCDEAGSAPTVRVVDKGGNTVTWYSTTIRLLNTTPVPAGATQQPDPGLHYSDGATATTLEAPTTSGVATFGAACTSGLYATNLGIRYQLGARTTDGTLLTVPTAKQQLFDVVQYLADCGTTCNPGAINGAHTSAQVKGDNGTATHRLSISVGAYTDLGACTTDGNPNRELVGVNLADHTKTVTLKWDKKTVQWFTNNGTPFWDVCMWAQYPFTTKGGGTSSALADGWNAGVLPPCTQAGIDPTVDACVANLYKLAAEEYAVITLPDVPGDPQFR